MFIGLDTTATVTPTTATGAVAQGYSFICRYYASKPLPRVLGGEEAGMLLSNKLSIVPVFQDVHNAPQHFSAEIGSANGKAALKHAEGIGQKPGTAIYFVVVFDAGIADIDAIKNHFAAVKNAIDGKYKVGVYGSGWICDAIKRKYNLADYSWLAAAAGWKGSRGYADWNIKQGAESAGITVGNIKFGANEAQDDYGGWGL